MLKNTYTEEMLRKMWTQISGQATLKDVKKRFVDHLRSAGLNITDAEVRLWMFTLDPMDAKQKTLLAKTVAAVSKGSKPNSQAAQGAPVEERDPNVEQNSGVEFPGDCLEPLLNKAVRISQMSMNK